MPPADFLLEADKRGSPPKSEKRSFWEHILKKLGRAGRGVQPFCEKEKNNKENAESTRDSSPTAQNDKIMDCHADSANLLAMTKYYKFAFDSQSIRATNRNRSNGGEGFVFFEIFGIELD